MITQLYWVILVCQYIFCRLHFSLANLTYLSRNVFGLFSKYRTFKSFCNRKKKYRGNIWNVVVFFLFLFFSVVLYLIKTALGHLCKLSCFSTHKFNLVVFTASLYNLNNTYSGHYWSIRDILDVVFCLLRLHFKFLGKKKTDLILVIFVNYLFFFSQVQSLFIYSFPL